MELFIFGTFWFWALVAAAIVALFIFEQVESGFGATVTLIATLACLQWLGNVNILGYIYAHPWWTLIYVAGYFGIGAIWSGARWYLFCRDKREAYLELRAEWIKEYGSTDNNRIEEPNYRNGDPREITWKEWYEDCLGEIPPKVSKHKARILRQLGYWPIDAIWWCISDFVIRIARAIYQHISGILQRISNWVFSDILDA